MCVKYVCFAPMRPAIATASSKLKCAGCGLWRRASRIRTSSPANRSTEASGIWRYVPFDKQGADLLFGFITRVYERRSLIVTTNLPFAKWSEVFLDATAAAAVIDRIVHHATVLKTEGDSYRLRDATRKHRRRRTKEER